MLGRGDGMGCDRKYAIVFSFFSFVVVVVVRPSDILPSSSFSLLSAHYPYPRGRRCYTDDRRICVPPPSSASSHPCASFRFPPMPPQKKYSPSPFCVLSSAHYIHMLSLIPPATRTIPPTTRTIPPATRTIPPATRTYPPATRTYYPFPIPGSLVCFPARYPPPPAYHSPSPCPCAFMILRPYRVIVPSSASFPRANPPPPDYHHSLATPRHAPGPARLCSHCAYALTALILLSLHLCCPFPVHYLVCFPRVITLRHAYRAHSRTFCLLMHMQDLVTCVVSNHSLEYLPAR